MGVDCQSIAIYLMACFYVNGILKKVRYGCWLQKEVRVTENKKIKVGIIGANWSLKVHGAMWRMFPGVEVAAVCTAHRETAEAAARDFDIPTAYWNVQDLAADPDIDIIDVGSRPAFRYDMVMAALQGGKHVYNALPFAVDAIKARGMADLQQQKGVVGVVDAQFRWVPAAMHMKELLDQGFIGRPLGFNMQLMLPLRNYEGMVYPHPVWPGGGVSPYKWLGDSASGAGAWRNFGSHSVLFLSHLLGRVQEVSGRLNTGIKSWQLPDGTTLEPATEDLGCAVLQLENGAVGNLQCGWSVPDAAGLRVEVWGDQGRLLLVDPSFGDGLSARLYTGDARLHPFGQSAGEWLETPAQYFAIPDLPFSRENAQPYAVSMGWMFHHMLEAIRHDRSGSPSFSEALHAQCVVEALAQSSESRSWVNVKEILD